MEEGRGKVRKVKGGKEGMDHEDRGRGGNKKERGTERDHKNVQNHHSVELR